MHVQFLDPSAPAAPVSIEYGHTTPVYALCYTDGKLYAGSFEDGTGTLKGVTRAWDLATGLAAGLKWPPPCLRTAPHLPPLDCL